VKNYSSCTGKYNREDQKQVTMCNIAFER